MDFEEVYSITCNETRENVFQKLKDIFELLVVSKPDQFSNASEARDITCTALEWNPQGVQKY